MQLCDIFNDYKNGVPYKFETEFETLYFNDDNRYEDSMNDLTRVVTKYSFDEIVKLTNNDTFNQGYFFLPTHVCEKIDEIFFEFSENKEYNGRSAKEINELKAKKINELICNFKNPYIDDNDKSSTSFFIVQSDIDNCDSAEILLSLKERVSKNTEELAILRGNICNGNGLLRKSQKFKKPDPKCKHISFWKKKTGCALADFTNISNQFNLLEKNYEINE